MKKISAIYQKEIENKKKIREKGEKIFELEREISKRGKDGYEKWKRREKKVKKEWNRRENKVKKSGKGGEEKGVCLNKHLCV